MRSVLFTTLTGLLAVFIVTSPTKASATPTAAVLKYSPATASEIVPIRRYKRRYRYRRPHYRPYRYYRRPHYRPYRYYGRPYYGRRYYGRRYPYYGRGYWRPRVGVYVGI